MGKTDKKRLGAGARILIVLGSVVAVLAVLAAGVGIAANALYNRHLRAENAPAFASRPQTDKQEPGVLTGIRVLKTVTSYPEGEEIGTDDVRVKAVYFLPDGSLEEREITDYTLSREGDTLTVSYAGEREDGSEALASASLAITRAASGSSSPAASVFAPVQIAAGQSSLSAAYSDAQRAKIKEGILAPIYTDGEREEKAPVFLLIETAPYAEGEENPGPADREKANTFYLFVPDETGKKVRIIAPDPLLLVPVEGYGENTLRGAYAIGGPGMLINTLNSVLGTSVRYYLETSVRGIVEYADGLGGVTLTVTEEDVIRYGLEGVVPGKQEIKGKNAEKLMHYDAREGDNALQQAYYEGLYVLAFESRSDYLGAITGFLAERRVVTNMPLGEFVSAAWELRWAAKGVTYDFTDIPGDAAVGEIRADGGAILAVTADPAAIRAKVAPLLPPA